MAPPSPSRSKYVKPSIGTGSALHEQFEAERAETLEGLFPPVPADCPTLAYDAKAKAQKRVDGLDAAALFVRWHDDVEILANAVHDLVFTGQLMTSLLDEIEQVGGDGAGTALDGLARVYAAAQTTAMRRLIDHDTRARSFVLLLEELEVRHDLFTRARQRERYEDAPEGTADFMFDQFASEGNDAVPAERFAQLRASLAEALEGIKTFVNKRVAHDDRGADVRLEWHDIDDAIDVIASKLRAVGLIVFGRDVPTEATPQQDWRAPFRQGLFKVDT